MCSAGPWWKNSEYTVIIKQKNNKTRIRHAFLQVKLHNLLYRLIEVVMSRTFLELFNWYCLSIKIMYFSGNFLTTYIALWHFVNMFISQNDFFHAFPVYPIFSELIKSSHFWKSHAVCLYYFFLNKLSTNIIFQYLCDMHLAIQNYIIWYTKNWIYSVVTFM